MREADGIPRGKATTLGLVPTHRLAMTGEVAACRGELVPLDGEVEHPGADGSEEEGEDDHLKEEVWWEVADQYRI